MRRVQDRFSPRAVILLYHRIASPESDPYRLRVTPEHFAEHLAVIRELGQPMHLSELAQGVRDRKLPDRAVCVTFDDGYADNLGTARQLLERHDVPATVFVTTGIDGRTREFWWDELEGLFLQPGRLPEKLSLEVGNQQFEWELADGAGIGSDELQRHSAWTIPDPDGPESGNHPTDRHRVFCDLYRLIRRLDVVERRQLLDHLLRWAGREQVVRPTRRALDLEDISRLEQDGLVQVGAHTVNHPALPSLSAQDQRAEVVRNKAELERRLGHQVKSFAYPDGMHCDASVAEVRAAGFSLACACSYRAVRRGSDVFLLPRVAAFDTDGDQFARALQPHLST